MAALLHILTLVCILYSCNQLCEARKDTKGRTFSLAFFPEFTGHPGNAPRNILYLSSPLDGVCTVNYNDFTRRQTNVNVVANDVVEVALSDATQLRVGTGIEPKAIYVNCTTTIALYGHNKFLTFGADSSDSFTVLPDDTLSTDYIVASVEKTANLGVVATQNNTDVSVALNATCQYVFNNVRYTDGDTVNVTLGYGDVFQIGLASSSSSDKCDLGGTRIHSNYQVAVFSGALLLQRTLCGATDAGHMVSQVPPENAFSKTHIIPKVNASDLGAMSFRVLAKYDNTVVNITKEEASGNVVTWSTSLNIAEFEQYCSLSSSTFIIQSARPVLCTEHMYFKVEGGTSLFVPGTALYDNNFIVKSLDLDVVKSENPIITIVSEVSSFLDVRVNGQRRDDIQWTNLTTVPYTVGELQIQPNKPYVVNSSSPILVRLHERYSWESYSYNAGYRFPSIAETLYDAVTLKCLPGGWFVTVDFMDSNTNISLLPHIYMTKDTCVGTMQGQQLIFNMSYNDCHTQSSVSKGLITYRNRLMYVQPTTDHLVRDVIWIQDISCSEPVDGTDSVHIYPHFNSTVHGSISGQMQGSSVRISLYKDASYMHLVKGDLIEADVGAPVYVQVTSAGTSNTIMVLRSCDAHLDSVPGKQASYPLIADGCAVDAHTLILVTRNSVTRFKFDMFDVPNEQDGIYVTCHVTFCDQMDFSDKCQQQCHRSPHIIG